MKVWAGVLVALFCLGLKASAQTTQCPLKGMWWIGSLNAKWGESTVYLDFDKKAGANPNMGKRSCNGYIYMADVYFESEKSYCLTYNKTTAPHTYEFTVHYMNGRQLATGKVQLKTNGKQMTVTGLDALMKKQPFNGKTYEGNNEVVEKASVETPAAQSAVGGAAVSKDVLSAHDAFRLAQKKDVNEMQNVLKAYGYTFKGKGGMGTLHWVKNCSLTDDFTVKPAASGVSSVVRYALGGEFTVQVFSAKAAENLVAQFQAMGYQVGSPGMASGAVMLQKNFNDENEDPIYVITEKGGAYQERGGYFLIIGGEL